MNIAITNTSAITKNTANAEKPTMNKALINSPSETPLPKRISKTPFCISACIVPRTMIDESIDTNIAIKADTNRVSMYLVKITAKLGGKFTP